jgi:hypothetical protein
VRGVGGREILVFSAPYWVVRVNEWAEWRGRQSPTKIGSFCFAVYILNQHQSH